MSFTTLSGTATIAKSPAAAASAAYAARADGPSSATRSVSVCGPRELAITTAYPVATAARASWLPTSPAPMMPMVVIVGVRQRAAVSCRSISAESCRAVICTNRPSLTL